MFIVNSYTLAIVLCVITMLCWGSWGNTQKLARKTWRYELFYWDYVIGILLFSLIMGFTLGSIGEAGRSFVPDLMQVSSASILSAVAGEDQALRASGARSSGDKTESGGKPAVVGSCKAFVKGNCKNPIIKKHKD